MSKTFDNAVLTEIEQRFGEDVSLRFQDKSILKSMEGFFGNEANFQKSMRQMEIDKSLLGEDPLLDSSLIGLRDSLVKAVNSGKPILFVVSGSDEHRAAMVMLERFKDVVGSDRVTVKRLNKTSKDGFVSTVGEFTKKNGIVDDEFELVAIGCGSRDDIVVRSTISYINATGANMNFIGDINKPAKNNHSTKIGDFVVSSSQLVSNVTNGVLGELGDDVVDINDANEYKQQSDKLIKLASQMSKNSIPLEFRASNSVELAEMVELQKNFSFANNVDWMLGNNANAVDLERFHSALKQHGVDEYEFFESLDDVRVANITAGIMLRQVESIMGYGYDSESAQSFSDNLASSLENVDVNSIGFKSMSNRNNLVALRDIITDFKTRDNLSGIQINALGRMSDVVLDAKLANIKVKNVIKNSDLLTTKNNGCVKVTRVEDALFNVLDGSYISGMVGRFVDGVSVMMSNDEEKARHIYVRGDDDVLNQVREKEGLINDGLVGGVNSLTKDSSNSVFSTKEIDSLVSEYRDAAELKSTRIDEGLRSAPVIVVEPDTLGKALDIMNFLKVGHGNGIDPDIHFRIPVKQRIRVTSDGGEQSFLTIKEIADRDFKFETFECVYPTKGGDKSIYLDKNDLSAMHGDVGKKRFYGMLKTKFNPHAKGGRLAVEGYTPNYKIKYSRDVVLKSDIKKPSSEDTFWKQTNKNGNVAFYNNEKNIVDVNGTGLDKTRCLSALKDLVLGTADRMAGGVDLNGEYGVWCLDTETTGLLDSDALVNIGAAAYSVVKGSGTVIDSSNVYRTLNGDSYVASGVESVSLDKIGEIDPSRIVSKNLVGDDVADDMFVDVLPSGAEKVENMALLNDSQVVINRKIKQKYVSALVKDLHNSELNEVAMRISGISNEQIEKYGLPVSGVNKLMKTETESFKQNCFIAHNSNFDTSVLANHSIELAKILTENGNFVGDSLLIARNNDTLIASKDVTVITAGSRTVEINDKQKTDVVDFLMNGKLGDSIKCEVGRLEFAETRGKVKLRVFDDKGGVFHKDFDVNNRDLKNIEDMFLSKTVKTYPSVKLTPYSYLNFENKALLSGFLENGSNGEKHRGINGYLEVFDGEIFAYKKGEEYTPMKIGLVGNADNLIIARELRSQSLGCDMERLIDVNKSISLIETIPTKMVSNDRLLEVAHQGKNEYMMLQTFQTSYDFSKTSNQNITNFIDVHPESDTSVLKILDVDLRNSNRIKIGCYRQSDSFIAAAKACDGLLKIDRDSIDAVSGETGIHPKMIEVAGKCLLNIKKTNKIKGNVFEKQSHCNAGRVNSDACVELPVLASVVSAFSVNPYDHDNKSQFLVNELSKTAVAATHHAVDAKAEKKILTKSNEQAVGFSHIGGALGKLGMTSDAIIEKLSKSADRDNIGVEMNKNIPFGYTVKETRMFRDFSNKILSFAKCDKSNLSSIGGIKALLAEKMEKLGIHSVNFVADVDKNISQIKNNLLKFLEKGDFGTVDLTHDTSNGMGRDDLVRMYSSQIESSRSATSIMPPDVKLKTLSNINRLEQLVRSDLTIKDDLSRSLVHERGAVTSDLDGVKVNISDRLNVAKLSAQVLMAGSGENWLGKLNQTSKKEVSYRLVRR